MQTFVQTVVSTGGGVMERRDNLPFLHSGLIVWLDLPPDGIVARMQASGEIAKRPLLANVRFLKNETRRDRTRARDVTCDAAGGLRFGTRESLNHPGLIAMSLVVPPVLPSSHNTKRTEL